MASNPNNTLRIVETTPRVADDGAILAAWNVRQFALAEIEARGTFQKAEENAPDLAAIFDEADTRISEATAHTLPGLLAKAWVAWSYVGTAYTEQDARLHDLIRRANLTAFRREYGDDAQNLDWEHANQFRLIVSLAGMVGEG